LGGKRAKISSALFALLIADGDQLIYSHLVGWQENAARDILLHPIFGIRTLRTSASDKHVDNPVAVQKDWDDGR
jgi:hypothetical protein